MTVFKFVDKDADSVISAADISRTLKEVSGEKVSNEDINEMIFRFKCEQKGAISFEEYLSVMADKIDNVRPDELNYAFEKCMANSKGHTKEVRWKNEQNVNEFVTIQGLRKTILDLLDNKFEGSVSEEEIKALTAETINVYATGDKISKSEFAILVSFATKNPFVTFACVLFDLDTCPVCILERLYICAKVLKITNTDQLKVDCSIEG